MHVGCKLLATYDKDRVSALGSSSNSSVIEDKGPVLYRVVKLYFSLGT